MAVYGYNRTSTRDQHLDRGNKAIRDFCAQQGLDLIEIYSDQQTGKSFDRPEYRPNVRYRAWKPPKQSP